MAIPSAAVDFVCHVLYAFGVVHLSREAFVAANKDAADVCNNFWAAIHDLILVEVCQWWAAVDAKVLGRVWAAAGSSVGETHFAFVNEHLLAWGYPRLEFFVMLPSLLSARELLLALSWLLSHLCVVQRYVQSRLLAKLPPADLLPPYAADLSLHHAQGAWPAWRDASRPPRPPTTRGVGDEAAQIRRLVDEVIALCSKVHSTMDALGLLGQQRSQLVTKLDGSHLPYHWLLCAEGNADLLARHEAALQEAVSIFSEVQKALEHNERYFSWMEAVVASANAASTDIDPLDDTAASFLGIPLPDLEMEMRASLTGFLAAMDDVQGRRLPALAKEKWHQLKQRMDPALFNNLAVDLRQISSDIDMEMGTIDSQLSHFLKYVQAVGVRQQRADARVPAIADRFAALAAAGAAPASAVPYAECCVPGALLGTGRRVVTLCF